MRKSLKGQAPLERGSPKKNSKFLTGQATAEYFLLFLIISIVSFLAVSAFYKKSWDMARDFFDKARWSIVGESASTVDECPYAGGEKVVDQSGVHFCRFRMFGTCTADRLEPYCTCPTGWHRFENWSTTTGYAIISTKSNCPPITYTVPHHSWANIAPEILYAIAEYQPSFESCPPEAACYPRVLECDGKVGSELDQCCRADMVEITDLDHPWASLVTELGCMSGSS